MRITDLECPLCYYRYMYCTMVVEPFIISDWDYLRV